MIPRQDDVTGGRVVGRSTGRGRGRIVGLNPSMEGPRKWGKGGLPGRALKGAVDRAGQYHAAGSGDRSRPSGRAGRWDSRHWRQDIQARRAPCTPTTGDPAVSCHSLPLQESHPAWPQALSSSVMNTASTLQLDLLSKKGHRFLYVRELFPNYPCQRADAGLTGSYCSLRPVVCVAPGGRASAQRLPRTAGGRAHLQFSAATSLMNSAQ